MLGTHPFWKFESGGEAVYGGYLLARTQAVLPEVLSIPQDISALVQKVYGPKEPDFPEDLQDLYAELRKKHETLLANQESKANLPYRPSLIKPAPEERLYGLQEQQSTKAKKSLRQRATPGKPLK